MFHDDVDREMAETRHTLGGMEVRAVVGNMARTPLDECGHVYKDLDEVLRVLEPAGVAEVAHRLYPVANIKGADWPEQGKEKGARAPFQSLCDESLLQGVSRMVFLVRGVFPITA